MVALILSIYLLSNLLLGIFSFVAGIVILSAVVVNILNPGCVTDFISSVINDTYNYFFNKFADNSQEPEYSYQEELSSVLQDTFGSDKSDRPNMSENPNGGSVNHNKSSPFFRGRALSFSEHDHTPTPLKRGRDHPNVAPSLSQPAPHRKKRRANLPVLPSCNHQ